MALNESLSGSTEVLYRFETDSRKLEEMKSLPLLDLHGFRLEDVDDAVDRFLVKSQAKSSARVRIMTGQGTGQVKKAVTAYLKRGGFPFSEEKKPDGSPNPGVLIVFLDD